MAGKHFEDLGVGDKFVSVGRTVTETDIVTFLNLARNLEPQFSNREFYENTGVFKRLASPGALTFVIALGLFTHLGLVTGTSLAFLGMDEYRVPNPLFCGDTLHLEVTVVDKRLSSRPGRGVVTFEFTGRKQNEEVVFSAKQTFLFACRPTE